MRSRVEIRPPGRRERTVALGRLQCDREPTGRVVRVLDHVTPARLARRLEERSGLPGSRTGSRGRPTNRGRSCFAQLRRENSGIADSTTGHTARGTHLGVDTLGGYGYLSDECFGSALADVAAPTTSPGRGCAVHGLVARDPRGRNTRQARAPAAASVATPRILRWSRRSHSEEERGPHPATPPATASATTSERNPVASGVLRARRSDQPFERGDPAGSTSRPASWRSCLHVSHRLLPSRVANATRALAASTLTVTGRIPRTSPGPLGREVEHVHQGRWPLAGEPEARREVRTTASLASTPPSRPRVACEVDRLAGGDRHPTEAVPPDVEGCAIEVARRDGARRQIGPTVPIGVGRPLASLLASCRWRVRSHIARNSRSCSSLKNDSKLTPGRGGNVVLDRVHGGPGGRVHTCHVRAG